MADYETGLNIQLWKFYQDVFNLVVTSPGGEQMTLELPSLREAQAVRRTLEQTQLLCYLGKPLPYNVQQEIFIDMIPMGSYINSGVWRMALQPVSVVTESTAFTFRAMRQETLQPDFPADAGNDNYDTFDGKAGSHGWRL